MIGCTNVIAIHHGWRSSDRSSRPMM